MQRGEVGKKNALGSSGLFSSPTFGHLPLTWVLHRNSKCHCPVGCGVELNCHQDVSWWNMGKPHSKVPNNNFDIITKEVL